MKWLSLFVFLSLQQLVFSQAATRILITDSSGHPLPNATVEVAGSGIFQADAEGRLVLKTARAGTARMHISSVGFRATDTVLPLQTTVHMILQHQPLMMETVEIKALRAGNNAPFAKTNLGKKDIEKENLGQDLPFLLSMTPSVTINSDAGNGIGYTGIRIRGTDATRINVTLNGIPYNDAESQGTYFVDLPDLSSSLTSVQVTRGVGPSSNGAGAFGAGISLSTNEVNEKAYAEINTSAGSFNTLKNTIRFGTGLLHDHFTFDARLSRISSDGFIDRSSTNLKSIYASAAWLTKKSSLRFNIITGTEKTYQAWNGIPEYKLFYNKDSLLQHYFNNQGYLYFNTADSLNLFNSNPRRYNVFTYPNQTDNYQQDHYQLFFNHRFNGNWTINTALYLSKGKGYYEEYKTGAAYSSYGLPDQVFGTSTVAYTDLVRRLWLDNNLYGTIFSVLHNGEKGQFSAGGGWNEYDGQHYGNIVWAANGAPKDYEWYYHTAVKKDFNLYTKYQYNITPQLAVMADLQYRRVDYRINGTRNFPDLQVNKTYHFFNPKAGITYTAGTMQYYASLAIANKEPNREDYETGAAGVVPKPEQLRDLELGVEEHGFRYSWSINGYYMQYHDQLILTGKINDVGNALRINTPSSYRAGIEVQGRYQISSQLQVSGNFTVSENRINNFYDYTPHYDASFNLLQQDTAYFSKTPLAFSPAVTASGLISYFPFAHAEINTGLRYSGRQYLDNTGNNAKSIRAYAVQDLTLQYSLPVKFAREIVLVARMNNIWDRMYESNGYTYSYMYDKSLVRENFYFPMAGRNLMFAVNMKF